MSLPGYSAEIPGIESLKLKAAVQLLSQPELVIDRVTKDKVNRYTVGDNYSQVLAFVESAPNVPHHFNGFDYTVVATDRYPLMRIKSAIPMLRKFSHTDIYALDSKKPRLVGTSKSSGYLGNRSYDLRLDKSSFCQTSPGKGRIGSMVFTNKNGVVATIDRVDQISPESKSASYVLRMTPTALAAADLKMEISQVPLSIDERALLVGTILNLDTDNMYDPKQQNVPFKGGSAAVVSGDGISRDGSLLAIRQMIAAEERAKSQSSSRHVAGNASS